MKICIYFIQWYECISSMFRRGTVRSRIYNRCVTRVCVSNSGKATCVRRHCGLLQLASAAVQALRHSNSAKIDSLLAEEKGLLQCIDDEDSPGVIEQIVKNVNQQLKLPLCERLVFVVLTLCLYTLPYVTIFHAVIHCQCFLFP